MAINKKLDNLLRKKSYQKVKLRKYPSGHIVFDVLLNHKPALFLLDTGASGTILTTHCIEKYKLKVVETDESGTGAGSTDIQMQQSINNSIVLGSIVIDKKDLLVMDLKHVNDSFVKIEQGIIDGVLGADILTENKVVIDYLGLNFYMLE